MEWLVRQKNNLIYLPLFLLILFGVFPISFYIYKNTVKNITKLYQAWYVIETTPLYGVVDTHKPVFSIANLISGEWQKQIEVRFNEYFPLRKTIIRVHNQFYYQLFSKIYMYKSSIIKGQNGYLFEMHYLNSFCNSANNVYTDQEFNQWAKNILALSHFFEARGQKFLFIITPSKVSFYPEYIPKHYQCSKNSNRMNYKLGIQALKKLNVNFVDASSLIINNKSKYGKLLFPRGGTHWTNLSGAIASKEIIKKIAPAHLQHLDFSYTPFQAFNAINPIDTDLLDLSNLLFSAKNYPVARVDFASSNAVSKPLSIAFIGGSFGFQIVNAFQKFHLVSTLDYFFYMYQHHFLFLGDSPARIEVAFNPYDHECFKSILNANVVILEENESSLGSTFQAKGMAEMFLH